MTERAVRPPGWPLVLVLFAVAGLLLLRDCHSLRQGSLAGPIGKAAPDAPVVAMDGAKSRLHSFHGRPLWLNFFATWCQPCKAEMPEIEQRYKRLGGASLAVVGVDQQETPALVARFARPLALSFPIVIDDGPAASAYDVFALPTSVFIDEHGVVQAVHVGEMSPQQMDADLARIISVR